MQARWVFDDGDAHEAIIRPGLLRSPSELIRLAERYADYLSERTANPYLAWGRLGQIIRALPSEQAFDLVCHFIHTLPRSCLASFGGGTLAHLVDHHGEALIDWIEHEAWRDVDFLAALSGAWVAGEGVHPTILIRLRVATGARIHIVRRPARDAAYKAMFESWITGRPQRRIRPRKHPFHIRSFGDEPAPEALSRSTPPVAQPRSTTDVPKAVLHDTRARLSMRLMLLHLQLQSSLAGRSPLLRYMARGAVMVCYFWLLLTAISAPLLPALVVTLCIISASPLTDLIAVALAFVFATVGAAVAGLVTGIVAERRREFPFPLASGAVMSLTPYVALVGLIARSEHGLVVAPAVVTAFAAGPFVWRFFRRARVALRHV